jgi:hypothetical protein
MFVEDPTVLSPMIAQAILGAGAVHVMYGTFATKENRRELRWRDSMDNILLLDPDPEHAAGAPSEEIGRTLGSLLDRLFAFFAECPAIDLNIMD